LKQLIKKVNIIKSKLIEYKLFKNNCQKFVNEVFDEQYGNILISVGIILEAVVGSILAVVVLAAIVILVVVAVIVAVIFGIVSLIGFFSK